MSETKKPAIRFKGFSDEWEQHPMDELTTELHEYATLDSLYPLLTSSREGIMFQNEYRSNRTTENNKTLFSVVPYGKCTYRHMSDDDIFHFNINDIVENGLVSREYPVFDSTDNNNLRFIVALLNSSEQFRKFCRERKIGGTRTRLYYKDLSNFKPLCPEFDEQQNIAGFLDSITSIISHYQSKLEKLQALKASMLEKMFPKDGADVPGVRFKEFTGAWERYKFSELYASVTQKNDLTYGTNKNITVATMQYRPDIQVTDVEYLRTYNVFKLGDIAFEGHQSKEFRYGRFVENDIGDGIVSHIFSVFRPKMNYDLKFWKYAINNEQVMRHVLVRCTKASTMMNDLVIKDFLGESILVPDIEEQKKIGTALADIDRLLSLCQQQLDKLQSIKKALLEKMFV